MGLYIRPTRQGNNRSPSPRSKTHNRANNARFHRKIMDKRQVIDEEELDEFIKDINHRILFNKIQFIKL